ncbi:uncharacterized protein Grl62a [Drosophila takahashii]|uniref:uncharacterized protein Grl62a n=1 Tax=Drosophila takahashii TaxID=29030 RepID=UPI001CF8C7C7|nr:uncharacterized protein LOC108056857 [Drosophila takahashii]
MPRLRFIFNIAKELRFPLHFFGLLQLKYCESRKVYQQRANLCRFLPAIFISLILLFHNHVSNSLDEENKLVNSLNIEKRPQRSGIEIWNEKLTNIWIFMTLIWSLMRKDQLWKLINEAQLAYKHLKSLLGKHLMLECSWLFFIYGLILLLLLAVFGVNLLYFCIPKFNSESKTFTFEDLYHVSNYIMGIPRLMFTLIITMHILYHLINAGWLQSLGKLRLQRNLKLFQFQLRTIFSIQKNTNILAGHYFKISYICYTYMIVFRIAEFVQLLRFDTNEFVQRQKSQEDLEDEADWEGQENGTNPRGSLMKSVLILSWHLALWILLLAAAYKQQEEYFELMEKSWSYKTDENGCEMKEFLAESSWNGHSFKQLDILDLMFLSGISICEYQPSSICFVTIKLRKKNLTYINLNIISRPFKFLLNLVTSASIVYFVQQMELRHLQEYLKREA